MYAKILKECASALTLLVIESDPSGRDAIGKNLSRFFKKISYVSTAEEGLLLYRDEKYDLILVDIDTLECDTYRFIDNIHRHDLLQAMAIYSSRTDDAELMLKLLNSQIGCFIPKPSENNTLYQILSKVCGKIHDRAVLMHYVEMLENQHAKALDVSCKKECPMKIELDPIQAITSNYTPVPSAEEDDDFMLFPDTASVSVAAVDNSLYEDYYKFLDFDDHEELRDQLGDIDAALLNAFSDHGGDPQCISKLGTSLMRYGNVLLHYQFFSDMGTSILEFGKMINDESETIAERSGDLELLISGFCSGLQTYMSEVWDSESANPKFFNDSIINDAQTIMSMMAPAPATNGDDDDDLFFF